MEGDRGRQDLLMLCTVLASHAGRLIHTHDLRRVGPCRDVNDGRGYSKKGGHAGTLHGRKDDSVDQTISWHIIASPFSVQREYDDNGIAQISHNGCPRPELGKDGDIFIHQRPAHNH